MTSKVTTLFPRDWVTYGHHYGVLPDHRIEEMIRDNVIKSDEKISDDQIQPASLDLRLGAKAYRIRASFLPGPHCTVEEKLAEVVMHEFEIGDSTAFERGCVYLVPLMESLELPRDISATANPKSSTGRLDVFTRILCDYSSHFDVVPKGYKGPLYAEVSPRTFGIVARPGSRLAQIRFRRGDAVLSDEALLEIHKERWPLTDGNPIFRKGLAIRVDLKGGASNIIGYRAKHNTGLIDIDAEEKYDPADYWEPVFAGKKGELVLDVDQFYLLASKNTIAIPPAYAAEMVAFDALMGECRVHYAGFFDPGFGFPLESRPSRAVLEVRSRDVPFVLTDGQVIARLTYEQLTELPNRSYGATGKSHYQGQGLQLGKQFVRTAWGSTLNAVAGSSDPLKSS